MAEFLGDTYGVMLYQEDVMKVAVNLAGYDMHGANGLRQTLSKASNPAALQEERLRFMNGKAAVGLTPAQAETIWESVSRFSKYAYCKAHATVYGRLAWLTARLKAHHPREFLAAVLNHHKSMYPARVFVWDALRHGIPVLPPDIQSSGQEWMPVQHGVLAGLDLVRGVSGRTCAALLQERERQPFASLSDLLRRVPFARGELERLVLVGACRCWGPRSDLLAELQETGPGGCQPLLIGPDMAHPVSLLRAQLELTGIPFCMHPVELVHNRDICLASDMKRKVGRTVTMAGILDSTKLLHTQPKGGKPEEMSFVTLEDASGMYDAILFPDRHVCLSRLFVNLGPYQLTGRIVRQWGTCSLEVADAAPLPLPA
jgi:DNA polymerase III alpha subunit